MRVQNVLLAKILADNRNTRFGKEHHFADIDSYEAYVKWVPVGDFERLRPYVDAEISTGETALTQEAPLCYMRTSGTTGQAKDLPLVSSHLDELRRIHRTAVAYQHRICPQAFSGSILTFTSPATEGVLANGKPYGSASGIVSRNTASWVRRKFIVPPTVLGIGDSRLKYLLILRLALARADVSYIGAANPSTLLALIKLYREYADALIDDIREGGFFLSHELSDVVLAEVKSRLQPDAGRARQLASLHAGKDGAQRTRIADIWPQLHLIVAWTCASAGVAAAALRRELNTQTRILELGYVSSEFRGTITLGRSAGSGLPTLDTHFFEFVERAKWDADEPEYLTLDRVRKGIDYYVIVTTPSGLYRYFINDLVRVTGFLHQTPLLKFAQKGKGVTSITGEKLYESQVLASVAEALETLGRSSHFLMMLADETNAAYRLFVELEPESRTLPDTIQLAALVDERLARVNLEYQAKRESKRLGDITVHWLRTGTGEAYKRHCVAGGQREGQFKMVSIAYSKDFGFDFAPYIEHSEMRLASIQATGLSIPFNVAFKHASAERNETQSLWVESRTESGHSGYGEGCPREYVTGESLTSAMAFVNQHRPDWLKINDLPALLSWVAAHKTEIDTNPSAWTAVELSLLDVLGRAAGRSVESLLGLPELSGEYRYTAVLGDASASAFQIQLTRYLKTGFTQFKIKLSGTLEQDIAKVSMLKAAGVESKNVRADANNLWPEARLAISHLQALDYAFIAIEEPLKAGDHVGLKDIAESLGCKIILDESLLRADQLSVFARTPQHWIVNLRISKMGGLLRSLELVAAIRAANLGLIIGAHVGETSVLTRAALSVANSARDILLAQEGAFGTHLLSRDVVSAPLMFAQGGVLDVAQAGVSGKSGMGLAIEQGSV